MSAPNPSDNSIVIKSEHPVDDTPIVVKTEDHSSNQISNDQPSNDADLGEDTEKKRKREEHKLKREKKDKKDKKDKKEKKAKKEKKEKRSKTASTAGSRYVDTAATLDDDDEDDDDDDEDGIDEYDQNDDFIASDDDDQAMLMAQARRSGRSGLSALMSGNTHKDLEAEIEARDLEELRAQADSRFTTADEAAYEEGLRREEEEEKHSSAPGHRALPSVADPKLFLVKCDPGKEALAVHALSRAVDDAPDNMPLFVLSAFTTPGAKGWVYVEAQRKLFVERAIRAVPELKSWGMKNVPLNEMVQAVTVRAGPAVAVDNATTLRLNTFVRIKGIRAYMGDLALVVRAAPDGSSAVIKLVPRVDYASATRVSSTAPGKAAQGLFEADKARHAGLSVIRQVPKTGLLRSYFPDPVYECRGAYYHKGFLYKAVSTHNAVVDITNAPPQTSEIEMFNLRAVADEDDDGRDDEEQEQVRDQAEASALEAAVTALNLGSMAADGEEGSLAGKVAPRYSPGDHIVVLVGEYRTMTGIVKEVRDGVVLVNPTLEGLQEHVEEFDPSHICRVFAAAERVLITGGEHKGLVGVVAHVSDGQDLVSVLLDEGSSVDVPMELLQQTAGVMSHREELDGFRLGALVSLNSEPAVVVGFQGPKCRLMTLQSKVVSALPRQLRLRVNRGAVTVDVDNVPVQMNDTVIPVTAGGAAQRHPAVVVHVVGDKLVLRSKHITSNGGVFACPAKDTRKLVAPSAAPAGGVAAAGAAITSLSLAGAVQHKRGSDQWTGKHVTVTAGPYKGLAARVVSSRADAVILELTAKKNKVMISKSHIREAEVAARPGHAAVRANAPAGGLSAQTPFLSAKTPNVGLGFQTPAHGAATPFFAGMGSSSAWDDDDDSSSHIVPREEEMDAAAPPSSSLPAYVVPGLVVMANGQRCAVASVDHVLGSATLRDLATGQASQAVGKNLIPVTVKSLLGTRKLEPHAAMSVLTRAGRVGSVTYVNETSEIMVTYSDNDVDLLSLENLFEIVRE